MKRLIALLTLASLLSFTGSSYSGPQSPLKLTPKIDGLRSYVSSLEFKGGERACAITIGDGRTFLGLYVYDKHGNCVAWDDEGQAKKTHDDLAAEWFPTQTGTYVVEVFNIGMLTNNCKVYLR
jgi:hypothetical protein